MQKLIEILKSETETLRVQYLEKTKEWATNYYNICKERKNWHEVEWCKFFGLTPEIKNPNSNMQFLGYPKGFYNTKKSSELHRYQNEIHRTLTLGLEKYIEKELKYAEIHYESSIIKLDDRIEKKGLNQDKITVVTSHIGVNINITLTDGEKTVRAFTIIAEGEIQRPHYRYLIK
jgi:hypothetical protein